MACFLLLLTSVSGFPLGTSLVLRHTLVTGRLVPNSLVWRLVAMESHDFHICLDPIAAVEASWFSLGNTAVCVTQSEVWYSVSIAYTASTMQFRQR